MVIGQFSVGFKVLPIACPLREPTEAGTNGNTHGEGNEIRPASIVIRGVEETGETMLLKARGVLSF